MNQKGAVGIIAAIVFVVVVIIIIAIPKGPANFEAPGDPLASLLPSPSSENKIYYYDLETIEDAIKHPEASTKLRLCGLDLKAVSPKVGELTNTKYLDLSRNSLTSLPTEISNLKDTLQELVLVENNFSKEEQEKIIKLLPYTNVAFSPQKNFDPYFKDNWETYDSKKFGFSFRYHPDLLVKEQSNNLSLQNNFAEMNMNAFDSCAIESAYINLSITIEDNPQNLTPLQYLSNLWNISPTLQGETYVVSDQDRMMKMVKYIRNYKTGDIDGIIADAGESGHPRIITSRNGKMYIMQFHSGGETGSKVPPLSEEVLGQTLATFKFAN